MKDLLQKYYSTQRNAFMQHLSRIETVNNNENIHQLRLSVKRIRALITFLQYLNGEKSGKEYLKALKKIYKAAGETRDTQVQLSGIKTYEKRLDIKYILYRDYLIKSEAKSFEQLIAASNKFSPEPLEKLEKVLTKILEEHSEEHIKQKASGIFDHKLKRIAKLHKLPTDKNKNLHEIRKILKEARYLLSVFSGGIGDFKVLSLNYERLKEIEKTLGKWHDQVNAEIYLKRFFKNTALQDKGEIMRYKILEKSIRRYKLLLQKRIELAFKYELEI